MPGHHDGAEILVRGVDAGVDHRDGDTRTAGRRPGPLERRLVERPLLRAHRVVLARRRHRPDRERRFRRSTPARPRRGTASCSRPVRALPCTTVRLPSPWRTTRPEMRRRRRSSGLRRPQSSGSSRSDGQRRRSARTRIHRPDGTSGDDDRDGGKCRRRQHRARPATEVPRRRPASVMVISFTARRGA